MVEEENVAEKEVPKEVAKEKKAKLDKEGLNDVLVKLRRPITQAKVHVIHKLTKDISMLKKRKTKVEADRAKNERKVARFVQEVQALRKEPKDTMARWLVAHQKSLVELTREETASQKMDLRLRAVVRVGEHKAVRAVLVQFHQQHPHWKSRVPKLLKSLGKQRRKKDDPNKEALGVKAKVGKVKKEELKDKVDLGEISGGDEGVSEEESEEEDEDVEAMDEDEEENSNSDEDDESTFVNSLKALVAPEVPAKEAIAKTVEEKSKANKPSKIGKSDGQMLVQVLDLKNATGGTAGVQKEQKENTQPLKKPEAKKSSFFVGGESESEESEEEYQEQDEGSLHPSWAAKKRTNPSITKFEGKKTKFDSEGGVSSGGLAGKGAAKGEVGDGKGDSGGAKGSQAMHPSWAAKQNQKTGIQSFQGTKVVFDD